MGDEDVGYGPARLFSAAEVREIHASLSRINREIAQRRFDGAAMDADDVYPQIWSRTDEDVFEYAWSISGRFGSSSGERWNSTRP